MLPIIIILLLIGATLCASPVYFAVCFHASSSTRFGFGLSILLPEISVRAAKKRAAPESALGARRRRIAVRRRKRDFTLQSLAPMLTLFGCVFRRARLERLCADGVLRTRSAASTALLWGAAQSAVCATGRMSDVRVSPDFSSGTGNLTAYGMISVRLGHIIAVLILHPKELFELWKSTQSKA